MRGAFTADVSDNSRIPATGECANLTRSFWWGTRSNSFMPWKGSSIPVVGQRSERAYVSVTRRSFSVPRAGAPAGGSGVQAHHIVFINESGGSGLAGPDHAAGWSQRLRRPAPIQLRTAVGHGGARGLRRLIH